ncbi:hypothetical protein BJH93_00175 [Kocuria polaris]|nr:hypothetical protein [Kocuria polaris]
MADATGSFAANIQDAHTAWSGLKTAYHGDLADQLHQGLTPALREAETIESTGGKAARALEALAAELRTLREVRTDLVREVAAFNTEHGQTIFGRTYPSERTEYTRLTDRVADLSARYATVLEICTSRLLAALGEPIPQPATTYTPFAPGAITEDGLLTAAASVKAVSASTVTTTIRETGGTAFFVDSAGTAEHGTQWLPAHSTDTVKTDPARLHAFGAPLAPGFWAAQDTQLRQQWQNLLKDPSTGIFTNTQDFKASLSRNFRSAVPGFAEYDALKGQVTVEHRLKITPPDADGDLKRTTVETTRTSAATSGSKMAHAGVRGLGTVGAVASGVMTYEQEKEQRVKEYAYEHPGLSSQEIETEAAHDAAAQAVGQTVANVATAAAVGAAVGSIIPGPGTVVGLAIGIGVGVAAGFLANTEILPDFDGDGKKNSLAGTGGDLAESLSDLVRDSAI